MQTHYVHTADATAAVHASSQRFAKSLFVEFNTYRHKETKTLMKINKKKLRTSRSFCTARRYS